MRIAWEMALYDDEDCHVATGKYVNVFIHDTPLGMKRAASKVCRRLGIPVEKRSYSGIALAAGASLNGHVETDRAFLLFARPVTLYTVAHEVEHALQFLFPKLYLRIGKDNGGDADEQLARWMGGLVMAIWEKAQ